eukprot:744229-Prorocentrum_minimum.AAC.5
MTVIQEHVVRLALIGHHQVEVPVQIQVQGHPSYAVAILLIEELDHGEVPHAIVEKQFVGLLEVSYKEVRIAITCRPGTAKGTIDQIPAFEEGRGQTNFLTLSWSLGSHTTVGIRGVEAIAKTNCITDVCFRNKATGCLYRNS